MKQAPPAGRAPGFTLIELMVTIALVVIIMALAAPSFATYQRNAELSSTANAMLSSLAAARSEAMKRGRNVTVAPADGSSWASGWIVFVDINFSGTLEPTDTVLSREPAPPTTITAVTGSAPEGFTNATDANAYVMFNGSGYPRIKGGGFQASSLDFTIESGEARRIISSPAGRLRVCRKTNGVWEAGCSADVL